MDANELANRVAHDMLAAEGTGPAWGIAIEEAREDYARVSMVVRADMLNGHGIAHGGMIFALADTAFAYVCNGANHASVAAQASIVFLDKVARGRDADRRSAARWRAKGAPASLASRSAPAMGRPSPNSPAIRGRSVERWSMI